MEEDCLAMMAENLGIIARRLLIDGYEGQLDSLVHVIVLAFDSYLGADLFPADLLNCDAGPVASFEKLGWREFQGRASAGCLYSMEYVRFAEVLSEGKSLEKLAELHRFCVHSLSHKLRVAAEALRPMRGLGAEALGIAMGHALEWSSQKGLGRGRQAGRPGISPGRLDLSGDGSKARRMVPDKRTEWGEAAAWKYARESLKSPTKLLRSKNCFIEVSAHRSSERARSAKTESSSMLPIRLRCMASASA